MLIPADLQGEEDVVLAKIRAGEAVDHYETIRAAQGRQPASSISLTVSPLRNDAGEVVGASKIARDITERARLRGRRASRRRSPRSSAKSAAIVASTLDRDAIVQKVTDTATESDRRRVRRVLLQRASTRSRATRTCSTRCRARRRRRSPRFPHPRATAVFGADVPRRGGRAARRRHAGSALRPEARRTSACRLGTCRCAATWRCRCSGVAATCSADCSSATRSRASSPSSTSGWRWRRGVGVGRARERAALRRGARGRTG